MSEDEGQAALRREVERINAERGTNLTVPEILEGRLTGVEYGMIARFSAWSLLSGLLLLLPLLGFWMGVAMQGNVGLRVILVIAGVTGLALSFLAMRAAFRSRRPHRRKLEAIDEVIRRVESRS